MRVWTRATLAALGLVAASFTGFSAMAAENCNLQRVALLDMTTDASGTIMIPMTIEGKDAAMVLDTGAGHSWLSQSFAGSLSGERMRTTTQFGLYFEDAAGEMLSEAIKIKTIKLGDVQSNRSLYFMIASDAAMREVNGTTTDGLVGNNITRSFDLELDPAGHKVGFYLHHECGKSPVHWARQWSEIPIKKIRPLSAG